MKQEIWKTIEANPKYAVSNMGRVKNTHTNYIFSPRDNGRGYLYVDLYKNAKSKRLYIHRLVAQAFIPNHENKSEVNHINGIKSDNRLENLEWCTPSENRKHAYENNLLWSFYKFTKRKKILCVELKKIFDSPLTAAKEFNIKACGIYKCASGVNKTSNGYHWQYVD